MDCVLLYMSYSKTVLLEERVVFDQILKLLISATELFPYQAEMSLGSGIDQRGFEQRKTPYNLRFAESETR